MLLVASSLAGGCADSTPLHLTWPEPPAPLGFLAWSDRASKIARPGGHRFSLRPGEAPVEQLEVEDDAELLLLLCPDAAWEELGVLPTEEASASALLLEATETCPRGRVSGDPERPAGRVAASAVATVYRADLAEPDPSFEPARLGRRPR